ncbi:WYL domain-containing protein [Anaerocolumna jejuensis DSM 15929]|uniref:WYL domain-containing protein n=1 Tax=Anaerocolumna jejuensis DSM 15929 TaxID=1121322 RepID=A0A1M6UVX4_9FIRM|nr:WYL domain-containing protein [Anaerocolumna jejuensis]SHK73400.1 WYL domain-containing protein [Anaerocolumna jejuensis DSM 15929]
METSNILFSEIYGCYFAVVGKILEQAGNGISKSDMENLVRSHAFYDTAFHLLPKLFSGEWDLLEQRADGKYYSKLETDTVSRPMTGLEKAWLKALLADKRIGLFVTQSELTLLEDTLSEVSPLFLPEDFHVFDSAADGDPYEEENYIQNFKIILKACASKTPLHILYENSRQTESWTEILPHRIIYSGRDDKFRLLGVRLQSNGHHKQITMNFARILKALPLSTSRLENINAAKYFKQKSCPAPIVLEILKERNALERCMLQFASWEKQTEYEEERDCYICRIYYDRQDETELLIRILSFGPVVKVLGPEDFLRQVKKRVNRQYQLNTWEIT